MKLRNRALTVGLALVAVIIAAVVGWYLSAPEWRDAARAIALGRSAQSTEIEIPPKKKTPAFDPALSPKPYVNPNLRPLNLPTSSGHESYKSTLEQVMKHILGVNVPPITVSRADGQFMEMTPQDAKKLADDLMEVVKSDPKILGVLENIQGGATRESSDPRFPVEATYGFGIKPEQGAMWFAGWKPFHPRDVYGLRINVKTGLLSWILYGPVSKDSE